MNNNYVAAMNFHALLISASKQSLNRCGMVIIDYVPYSMVAYVSISHTILAEYVHWPHMAMHWSDYFA